MNKIYQHQQETWNEEECDKRSRVVHRDGYGTIGGPRGLISKFILKFSPILGYGDTKLYNGGCVRNGVQYDGEHKPLPIIPNSYEFITVQAWGVVIKKKDDVVRWG